MHRAALLFIVLTAWASNATAGDRIWVPIRWCGIEGAPSMDDPGTVNEISTDNVLWRRHERPTDAIYQDTVDMTFRAGATAAIKNGPQSFPIIYDPSGSGGDIVGTPSSTELSDAFTMCERAWTMGDPLYFEQSNNSTINGGMDTLLSTDTATTGDIGIGHNGAALNPAPADVKFVDNDGDGNFDIGERIYRDENDDNVVDTDDTLLTGTLETEVGFVHPADAARALLPVPMRVKYLDLIREPSGTFNIGYPAVQGILAISANDFEVPDIDFPVHGIGGNLAILVDDASQYLPPGPDFTLFETQLVGHEFGHALSLSHGDGIDDDMNGVLDDEDDPPAPFPGAGPGTLCDSNNLMSYCWVDNGTSGSPDMAFIGVGTPTAGILTPAQVEKLRTFTLSNVSDRIVDPVTPPLVSARVDDVGEVESRLEYIDIAGFSVSVDASRSNTILSLSTRRPFPDDAVGLTEFYYLLDIDANLATGGVPAQLADLDIPTDFDGAEYVARVRVRGLEVDDVVVFRFDPQTREFVKLPPNGIRAIRETDRMTVDYPFARRSHVPDGIVTEAIAELGVQDSISVHVPTALIPLTEDSEFRVEFISRDVATGEVDRARSLAMHFRLPIFPVCRTDPNTAQQGETVDVISTGLLPDREVHLLLGETEVANGMTDSGGNARIPMNIPQDARLGDRLVTVGALAVSADCSVLVTKRLMPPDKPGETCCELLTLQLWILIVLAIIGLIFLIRHSRR